MRRQTLTTPQQTILDFIATFTSQHGYPPTLREIGTAVGLVNINAVRGHLAALEKKGRITRAPDKARSIQVVPVASRLSRFKEKLHRVLGTDAGVVHHIVYGLAWPLLPAPEARTAADALTLRRALEREAAEHGWSLLRCDLARECVLVVVRVWPNHAAQRTVRRLQSAAEAVNCAPRNSGKTYVATTELDQLDALAAQLLTASDGEPDAPRSSP